MHANDSLDECGSKRDRHTTIGEGSIGVAPFAELLAHPSMAGVPVVVETPSELDGSPSAGHARDIALLRSLVPGRAPPDGLRPTPIRHSRPSCTARLDLTCRRRRTSLLRGPVPFQKAGGAGSSDRGASSRAHPQIPHRCRRRGADPDRGRRHRRHRRRRTARRFTPRHLHRHAATRPACRRRSPRGPARLGGRIEHVYTAALQGFAVRLPEAVADRLSTLPGVVGVEQDQPVHAADTTRPTPTWGLDRIDQRGPAAVNGSYTYTATGAGVTAYIIDTGIRLDHTDFGGRATSGLRRGRRRHAADDCNGHGTHVAGTSAARRTAWPRTSRWSPSGCSTAAAAGTTSGVIAGIDWVTANHQPGSRRWPT